MNSYHAKHSKSEGEIEVPDEFTYLGNVEKPNKGSTKPGQQ